MKVLFHQDNAHSHKGVRAMTKIHELKFEVEPHAGYLPDLVLSGFTFLSNLKNFVVLG